MKKFRVGISFLLLVLISIITNNIVLLINYLFALFLHEIAHLLVASKRGYALKQIKLDMFGLSIELEEKIDDRDSFAINIAGPVLNLVLVILCMATYWLFPVSFIYLNDFCMANLVLALFNMLPVYPLDGGKIVSSICKKESVYKTVDNIIRILLVIISIALFICSCMNAINLWWLVLVVFFITARVERTPTLSVFKYSKNKHIEQVVMYKVTGEENLYDLLRKITNKKYTIFYFRYGKNYYIDEDHVIDLATKIPLKTKVKNMLNFS